MVAAVRPAAFSNTTVFSETKGGLSAASGCHVVLRALLRGAYAERVPARVVRVTIMAVLSVIAAVREACSYRKADRELIRQYRFMQRIFASARAAFDRTKDSARQRDSGRRSGVVLGVGDDA